MVADISYDTYLGSTPTGSATTEVMIWLAAPGSAFPMSYSMHPIATPTICGIGFDLYKGPHGGHGANAIYTFVASAGGIGGHFSGDLMGFFDYLTENEGIDGSQYLQSVGAGMEAFTGSEVTFTTEGYSISVY